MVEPDPLILRVLDGSADAAERARLIARLAAEPALRRAWWEEVAWRGHLREELTAARGEESGRRLVARRRAAPIRRRSPIRMLVPLSAAAVLALAVAGWWLTRAPAAPAAPEFVSLAGSFTGSGELRLADGSRLSFAQADYRVESADGSRITLRSGQVAAQVAPRAADHPLVIATAHGEAVVVGTRFTLDVDAEATLLRVEEGTVQLAGRRVGAGGAHLVGRWGAAERTVFIDAASGPTVAAACRRLGAGDVAVLGAGVHERGGDADALATIAVEAAPGRPARICAAPGTTPTLRSRGWDVLRISGRHLVLSGLRFAGTADGVGNGVVLAGGGDMRIAGCSFADFGGDGLNARGVASLVIEDSTFTGNGARSRYGQGGLGIFTSADAGSTVLRRLRLTGNRTGPINEAAGETTGGHGLLLGRDPEARTTGDVLVEDCLINGNQGPGLSCIDAGTVVVRRSRILGNGSGPVGNLRVQLSGTGNSRIDLEASVLACPPGTGLLRLWPPAAIGRATGNQVWGGDPPGPGFTALEAAPSP